jgi:hypothetical protein
LREVDFLGFDYVAFADQDDIWELDKLRYAHEKASSDQRRYIPVMSWHSDGRKSLMKNPKQVEVGLSV